jgi:N-acetylmuramoyl-L-alanine amidase
MQSHYQSEWEPPILIWLRLIGRNIPLLIFLVLGLSGMLSVYWFFSPAEASAELIAAATGGNALSAPFFKPIPERAIAQRLLQSPGPLRIGIISGHKESDSGAVCADGLTEAEVNYTIAQKVVGALLAEGIHAEILDEFDFRLETYGGTAVISIHSDSCDYINELATGYKVAGSSRTDSSFLQTCVEDAYSAATQLSYNPNTITEHMTDYHVFRKLPLGVPAIIIETGFLNLDRALLTNNPDIPAYGILQGIKCYLQTTNMVASE